MAYKSCSSSVFFSWSVSLLDSSLDNWVFTARSLSWRSFSWLVLSWRASSVSASFRLMIAKSSSKPNGLLSSVWTCWTGMSNDSSTSFLFDFKLFRSDSFLRRSLFVSANCSSITAFLCFRSSNCLVLFSPSKVIESMVAFREEISFSKAIFSSRFLADDSFHSSSLSFRWSFSLFESANCCSRFAILAMLERASSCVRSLSYSVLCIRPSFPLTSSCSRSISCWRRSFSCFSRWQSSLLLFKLAFSDWTCSSRYFLLALSWSICSSFCSISLLIMSATSFCSMSCCSTFRSFSRLLADLSLASLSCASKDSFSRYSCSNFTSKSETLPLAVMSSCFSAFFSRSALFFASSASLSFLFSMFASCCSSITCCWALLNSPSTLFPLAFCSWSSCFKDFSRSWLCPSLDSISWYLSSLGTRRLSLSSFSFSSVDSVTSILDISMFELSIWYVSFETSSSKLSFFHFKASRSFLASSSSFSTAVLNVFSRSKAFSFSRRSFFNPANALSLSRTWFWTLSISSFTFLLAASCFSYSFLKCSLSLVTLTTWVSIEVILQVSVLISCSIVPRLSL